ncbi:zinc finger, CCHC-type containing protein [Tanacetum coccineum]
MGGLQLLVKFNNQVAADNALANSTLLSYFKTIIAWNVGSRSNKRLIWLSISGLPPQLWYTEAFTNIAKQYGTVLLLEDCSPRLLTYLKVRAKTVKELSNIDHLNAKDLRQKAKSKWGFEGDENSKYFHGIINSIRNRSQIKVVAAMSVVYVLTTPIPKEGENATVDQIRRRNKWDNDDYVCRDSLKAKYMAEDASSKNFFVSNFTNYKMTDSRPVMKQYNDLFGILGRFTQHKMNMDEAIQVSCIIDKLPPSWKDFKHTLKYLKEELTLVELAVICALRSPSGRRIVISDKPKGNNVMLNIVNENIGSAFMSTFKLNDSILWHVRLGHSVGIIHETNAPYTPQQNSIHERKNRVLKEIVNSILSYSGLNQGFWGEATLTACYLLINRVPNKRNMITTYEPWTKKKPNMNYLRVWVCRTVVRLLDSKLKTLGKRGIEQRMQAAHDRQKSYADLKRKPTKFQVGDKVMLKVLPWKGVVCFGKWGKLNPRYVGPFKVLEKVGEVAYKLELPEEQSRVHNTFHVSNLKKCHADE